MHTGILKSQSPEANHGPAKSTKRLCLGKGMTTPKHLKDTKSTVSHKTEPKAALVYRQDNKSLEKAQTAHDCLDPKKEGNEMN